MLGRFFFTAINLNGYSSGQGHFSGNNIKLVEKNKFTSHLFKKKTRNVQIMVLNESSEALTGIVRIFMLAWPRLLESWLALTNG